MDELRRRILRAYPQVTTEDDAHMPSNGTKFRLEPPLPRLDLPLPGTVTTTNDSPSPPAWRPPQPAASIIGETRIREMVREEIERINAGTRSHTVNSHLITVTHF